MSMLAKARFERYMNLPHRKKLTSAANDGTSNPRADDAGNWTGCGAGQGRLVGTYRDISACLYQQYKGRPIYVEDMRAMTYAEAKEIIRSIWDKMKLSEVPNQDVANITMHIKMHFGNVKIVQRALNLLGERLSTDGLMGSKTLAALKRQTSLRPTATYNKIRSLLVQAYEKSNPVYRKGFMSLLEDFPPKSGAKTWIQAAVIVAAIAIIYFIYRNYRNYFSS